MARGRDGNDHRLFNLNGPVEYIDKLENGYPVLEVHEFCCLNLPQQDYVPDTMAEGHVYDPHTQEPNLLVRNLSFYCERHNPANYNL